MRLLLVLLLLSPAALAESTEADEVLLQGYDKDRPKSILWYGGWVGIQTALTAGQLGLAIDRGPLFASAPGSEDWNYQGRMITGAATAALGLVAIAVKPPATLRPSPDDPAELRRRMVIAAAQERGARNWFAHLSVVVVNAAAATIVGTVFHSPWDAVVTFLAGVAIGEAQVWTRPVAAMKANRNARARFPADFAVGPIPGGLMVAGRW